MKKIIFISSLLFYFSCFKLNNEPGLYIKNNSTRAIYSYWQTDYPDTSIIRDVPPYGFEWYVPTKQKKIVYNSSWKEEFNDYPVITFFIFDSLTLATTNWDTIKTKYKILKRYDLKYEDIKRMNWTITYP